MKKLLRPFNLFMIACVLTLVVFLALFFTAKRGGNGRPESYLILRDPKWFPLELHGKGRELLAFTDELISDVAKAADIPIQLAEGRSGDLFSALRRGEAQGSIVVRRPTADVRNAPVLWSDVFYQLGPVLVVREDSDIDGIDDLSGSVVGVKQGSLLFFDISTASDIIFVTYPDVISAFDKLHSRSIDAVIAPYLSAHVYVNSLFPDKLRIGSKPLVNEGLRLMTLDSPWGEELIGHFNARLADLKESGEHTRLLQRWGLPSVEEDLLLHDSNP